jgi:glutaredoxin
MSVTIYGKIHCGYCVQAKSLCEQKGLDYTYLQLDEDYTFDEFKAEFPTARTFPQIIVDDNKVGGFTELKALTEVED